MTKREFEFKHEETAHVFADKARDLDPLLAPAVHAPFLGWTSVTVLPGPARAHAAALERIAVSLGERGSR